MPLSTKETKVKSGNKAPSPTQSSTSSRIIPTVKAQSLPTEHSLN